MQTDEVTNYKPFWKREEQLQNDAKKVIDNLMGMHPYDFF